MLEWIKLKLIWANIEIPLELLNQFAIFHEMLQLVAPDDINEVNEKISSTRCVLSVFIWQSCYRIRASYTDFERAFFSIQFLGWYKFYKSHILYGTVARYPFCCGEIFWTFVLRLIFGSLNYSSSWKFWKLVISYRKLRNLFDVCYLLGLHKKIKRSLSLSLCLSLSLSEFRMFAQKIKKIKNLSNFNIHKSEAAL